MRAGIQQPTLCHLEVPSSSAEESDLLFEAQEESAERTWLSQLWEAFLEAQCEQLSNVRQE